MDSFRIFAGTFDTAEGETELAIASEAAGWLRLQDCSFELRAFGKDELVLSVKERLGHYGTDTIVLFRDVGAERGGETCGDVEVIER